MGRMGQVRMDSGAEMSVGLQERCLRGCPRGQGGGVGGRMEGEKSQPS